MDQNLLAEANKDTESVKEGIASAKTKAEEVTKKEENDKQALQAEVLSDKAKLATAKQAHTDLASEVAAAEQSVKSDEQAIADLRKKVVNEQRAFLNAHQTAA